MRTLSIGMFTYSTRPRGSVVCAAQLAAALHEGGHDVTLYALDKGEGGFYRGLPCRTRLMRTNPPPPQQTALIAQRIAEVADFAERHTAHHDILHAMDCLVTNGLVLAKGRGLTGHLVRTVHHVDEFDSEYLRVCQRRSILQAEALISVSEATQREVRQRYARDSELVHNGIDKNGLATFDSDAWNRVKERLGIRGRFVMSVGGIEPRKNSVGQLQAFKCVHAAHPDLQWVIVGGASIWDHDSYRREFDSEARNIPSDALVLAGVVRDDEMAALYHHATVFLHAATHEGWGLSVLEAMAVGTPVVASQGSPFDEYLDESCAELVQPESFLSIAAGLERAIGGPPNKRHAAKRRARTFDWQRSAERHSQLYLRWCRGTTQQPPTRERRHA